MHAAGGEKLKVAYCRASALEADKAVARWVRVVADSLKAAGLEAEAETVAGLATATGPADVVGPVKDLPVLPRPGIGGKLGGEAIYEMTAPSGVVIKTRDGSGSGV